MPAGTSTAACYKLRRRLKHGEVAPSLHCPRAIHSRLANELGRRDYVTSTALKQGREVDAAVVVQRQPPMGETVLKA